MHWWLCAIFLGLQGPTEPLCKACPLSLSPFLSAQLNCEWTLMLQCINNICTHILLFVCVCVASFFLSLVDGERRLTESKATVALAVPKMSSCKKQQLIEGERRREHLDKQQQAGFGLEEGRRRRSSSLALLLYATQPLIFIFILIPSFSFSLTLSGTQMGGRWVTYRPFRDKRALPNATVVKWELLRLQVVALLLLNIHLSHSQ